MITKFRVRNFKSVESAELELGTVNVVIGANGSGKTNLLEAVSVLGAAAFGRVDQESLIRRGCRPKGFPAPMFAGTHEHQQTVLEATNGKQSYAVSLLIPQLGNWT